ncbi:protein C12orf4 homolog [Macrosteles quadrilineatus]|uniref:protein C12orf4 homolog n=1 Tax=Macrosteles quadrilineatus TaxID=74068 RepID=UPI0023E2A0BC|nr:protein C12orf4 homolog [Macrosteles quadrilineatus]
MQERYHNCMKKVEYVFTFPMRTKENMYRLNVPLEIPYTDSISELVQRLVTSFKLPAYVEDELEKSLKLFVEKETIEFLDELAEKEIEKSLSNETDVEDVIKFWEKSFKENTVEYGEKSGANDADVFSAVYHKLVHSPALETILEQEHSYAIAVAEVIAERDKQVAQLTERQTEEMCRAVDAVNVTSTEAEINQLAGRHMEQQSLMHAQWNSQVDAIKESQRRHYRQWLMDKQTSATTPINSPPSVTADRTFSELISDAHHPVMQESFTIHLGSQMKQMHNIRLLCTDVLDFCQLRRNTAGTQPQRLQTALALYSNDLCGLVLLSDTHLGSYSASGVSKDFVNVCQGSTEFHFSNVDDQIEKVKEAVKEGVAWRKNYMARESTQHLLTLTSSEQQSRRSSTKNLQTGDVYLTHHSNLAEVHVVFHMIVDDSLRSSDINSRHPAILGLRNILKTACSCDITTLTVPVLLTHEMTEEMTVAWCNKRAELVFKCVKGFMIEMASWGGSDLKNLQFLVPKGISEDVFASLAAMLPSIFRVSNPLVFKMSPPALQSNTKQDKKDKNNKNNK